MTAIDKPLRFAGYAALFDIPDGARDVIRPGAFARTLAARREPVPLFWQHRPQQRIGTVELLAEDARGLRVIAQIDNPLSRAAAELTARRVSGLSFGYFARAATAFPAGRLLEDIDLFEVSLVTRPLQPGARVHLIG
ncbi:HK97 family phage prohead protease [Croceibacterium sp. TMG7-5b_MA50]|uniref:HK97 family phage prohead protease n=1 Tax=Croceibacterium sp. TMG7-5b_MA50 TaxID=3121290 RepID=UPI00322161E9